MTIIQRVTIKTLKLRANRGKGRYCFWKVWIFWKFLLTQRIWNQIFHHLIGLNLSTMVPIAKNYYCLSSHETTKSRYTSDILLKVCLPQERWRRKIEKLKMFISPFYYYLRSIILLFCANRSKKTKNVLSSEIASSVNSKVILIRKVEFCRICEDWRSVKINYLNLLYKLITGKNSILKSFEFIVFSFVLRIFFNYWTKSFKF